MIQPINAFSPRAGFRGKDGTYGKPSNGLTNKNIAVINATGVAAAAGGLGTALARSQTASWSHAGFFGLCASLLTMFFMTPQIIKASVTEKNTPKTQIKAPLVKQDSEIIKEALCEYFKSQKKMIPFRQSA